jgi:HD-like signal output (HDOD) protein
MIDTEVQKGQQSQRRPPTNAAPWALDKLPPFPLVASRLMQLLAKEDPDISEVGRMIAAEPVFATRVLQMANSPLFALTAQVKTLSHAIVVLGLARVKSITVTRALGDFVAPALSVRSLRVCWQNSLAGALLAEKLARACKMDPDVAYVAGLLRDIGRLALLVKYPDSYANLLAVSGEHAFDLMSTERELFDVDHCQAGEWLMGRMPFPPELTDVVVHHHDLPTGKTFRLLDLIRIADRMADALGFAVVTQAEPLKFGEVLEELPEAALSRVHFEEEELRAEIDTRIQTWG